MSTYDSRFSPPIPRFRFPVKTKHMDMEDAKVALDIIIRPSLRLWKLALGHSAWAPLKRPKKTVILLDANSSSSSISRKKRVRFDEQPITISRRGFFERFRRDSSSSPNSSPVRPCLVIHLNDEAYHKLPEPPSETDNHSVYEDCLSDHPEFLADLQVLEGNGHLDTRPPKYIRRSGFYETESGIATFNRAGYANYCLSRWLDKQREEARALQKRVSEDPVFLPWSNPTLPQPSDDGPDMVRPIPRSTTPACKPPRSLPRRIWRYIEDEFHNAIVVLIIGSLIHTCLSLFLLYDILTRGLIPADD